ncbi:uncharacterized protein A1O9_06131 [Exophiala aquamarina CBS 119918]|uniref:Enoyl reductase (ER) domain-containing protein n=1 Tax=Exophiala aquamarina CBS 119918 TaxID=1182545 RepID=A0A072PRR3_9EURO|nr:uncharacterized protein A1O9_06131 [Exophiala aquamarina CBS 119918]KEF58205.1 hypothetical protein A1O9_06131 [Exophiala aquamarina CBS 119918]
MGSISETPAHMSTVTVRPTTPLSTELSTVPTPTTLSPDQVLIKVHVAASNPKDWLHLVARKLSLNSGDDLAGTVVAVGSNVSRLQIGARVAAFHPMFAPFGAYAEYAVAPAHTVLKIPRIMSYEEAATIPLVTATAALTLFRRQGFLAPWEISIPTCKDFNAKPLLIYAASSPLGTYLVKLAKLAGIGPIIAIGGGSSEYLRTLLDNQAGDVFLDYRSGISKVQEAVRRTVKETGLTLRNAIDAYSENSSWVNVAQMLEAGGRVSVFSGANKYDEEAIPAFTEIIYTFVGSAHEGAYKPGMPKQPAPEEARGDVEFAGKLFLWLEEVIKQRKFEGQPFDVVPGGLKGVEAGLNRLRDGKAAGKKLVYQVVPN